MTDDATTRNTQRDLTRTVEAPPLLKHAHSLSQYKEKHFDWFQSQLALLIQGKECEIDFDEHFYLEAHEDVRAAVARGHLPCGYVHFCIHGKQEGRLWSRNFAIQPHIPQGLVAPVFSKRNEASLLLKHAHSLSQYKEKHFDWFQSQLVLLIQGKECEIDFDEHFYLEAHQDVRAAVARGHFPCGYVHFCIHGEQQGRLWSSRRIIRNFGIQPHIAQGLAAPVFCSSIAKYGPDLGALPQAAEPFLVILVPRLDDKLFFAGYASFFHDIEGVLDRFKSITLVVTEAGFNAGLVTRLCDRIQVIGLGEVSQIRESPDLIYCFDVETFYQARDIFNRLDRTVYYCQDFEAGFFPLGAQYARSEGAVARSKNLVFSTLLLKDFMAKRGLLQAKHIYVTAPPIEPITVEAKKNKKLFFYFRPERFNTRNLPEAVMEAVEGFCRHHSGYEIFLAGTVDTAFSFSINGTPVTVLSKIPRAAYEELLGACDVVVALIYSAHPGVIAFQAAASGIPTVTNVFDNRDAACLQAISKNIVPYDPVRESLLDKVEVALNMPKGAPSFDKLKYVGQERMSFAEFNEDLLSNARPDTRV